MAGVVEEHDGKIIPSCSYFGMGYLYILTFYLIALRMNFIKAEPKTLNIMGLFPITGETWPGGWPCLTAVNMALRHIDQRDDILKDYKLNLTWRDSKCEAGLAVNMMYEMLYTKPIKHFILGPSCSVELEVTAQSSPAWNMTHVTYGGASPLLSDRKRFPRLFRLVAPDTRVNLARLAIIRYFGWKKIATLNAALDFFSAVTDHLVQEVEGSDITIISEEIFGGDPLTRIQNLKRKDARIILVASYEYHASRILCAAYQEGLYGPKIVWMFPGWFKEQWWKHFSSDVSCTDEQMALVAEGSILAYNFNDINETERGVANITFQEFKEMLLQDEDYHPEAQAFDPVGKYCYDAAWAIALALNCTARTLLETGHPKRLEDFQYSDKDIADIISSCLYNISFVGMLGHVKFERSGIPSKNVKLVQIQGGKHVTVGVFWTNVENNYIEWHNDGLLWKDGIPPRDSTFVTDVEVLIPSLAYIVASCFASFGILLAFSLFIFNIIYRNNVYVKLSSPNINNILLLGCIITYSSVFMESLQQNSAVLCKIRTFTLTIGFTMAFGALFSKTWRVYRIFSNEKLLRVRIKDSQLVIIVIALLAILCSVLILWEIVDPLFIVSRKLESEVYLIGKDAEVHPFIRICTSKYNDYFSWAIYILEGALLSFGAFLSFETRKVKITALNDSHLIGMCLYNVVVLSAVCLTLNLVLEDRISVRYGIMSGILIIGTTSTQLIVFVPKVLAVYFPHRVDANLVETLDGSRFGGTFSSVKSKHFERGEGSDNSSLKPTSSNTNGSRL